MKLRKIWLFCNLVCIIPGVFAQQFIHPGVLHSKKSLERIKRLVDHKVQPAYGSYEILIKLPEASADYQMKGPFEIISRDGKYSYTKSPSEHDFNSAYYNALLWQITGNKAHADKSMEIIRAYARTIRHIPPTNDAPLCAALQGFILVNVAEIMRYTYTETHYPNGWSAKDTECVEAMFQNVFQPVLSKFFQTAPYTNGNWGAAAAKAQLSFGIFLNDRKLYEDAIDFFYHGNDNGSLPNYIAESGQSQEAGRDQQHAMLGVSCLADMAEVAWTQGDDLYGALDNRIMKGYEYIAKSNLGYDVPFVKWKDITGKYSHLSTFGKGGMGRFRSVFEIAYNHYVVRKGLEMPYTKIVLGLVRPEGPGVACDNTGFGSLLYYGGDDLNAGKVNQSCQVAQDRNFNPIIPDNVADPSISKFGDTYYLYGTTDIDKGLEQMGPPVVWKSKDFVNWSFEGTILPEIEWNKPYLYTNKDGIKKYGYFRYWAPGRAVKKGDLYYLFPTIVSPDGTCPIYTLVSESPEGPFRFQNGDGLFWGEIPAGKVASRPLLPDIDGEPFTDDDGKNYMYWRRWKAAQVSSDFSRVEGEIQTLPTKRRAYSEGPTLFKRNNIYYYVYTQGGDQNYRNAYMISKEGPLTGFQPPVGEDVFIYSSLENGVWGPGHGNVFYDEDSQTYIFTYLEFGEGSTTRQVFADKMEFNADGTIKTIIPGFKGVGFLNNVPDTRVNLAQRAKVTASSHKKPKVSSKKVYTNFDAPELDEAFAVTATREFTYQPENATDGSNGTRWMASCNDKLPCLTLDFGEIKKVGKCEMYFNFPAFGHAWILEKSSDGKGWEVCAMQNEAVARSPHVANEIGEARYLRLKIIQGSPGLWEIKIYE